MTVPFLFCLLSEYLDVRSPPLSVIFNLSIIVKSLIFIIFILFRLIPLSLPDEVFLTNSFRRDSSDCKLTLVIIILPSREIFRPFIRKSSPLVVAIFETPFLLRYTRFESRSPPLLCLVTLVLSGPLYHGHLRNLSKDLHGKLSRCLVPVKDINENHLQGWYSPSLYNFDDSIHTLTVLVEEHRRIEFHTVVLNGQ